MTERIFLDSRNGPDPDLASCLQEHAQWIQEWKDPSSSAWELREAGQGLLAQGYHSKAEILLRLARRIALSEGDMALATSTTIDLAKCFHFRNPLMILTLAQELTHRGVDRHSRLLLFNLLGQALESLCFFESADRCYRLVIDNASISQDAHVLAAALANRGGLVSKHGSMDEARRLNERSIAILSREANKVYVGLVLMNMGIDETHQRNRDEAFRLFEKAADIQQEVCNVELGMFLALNRGELEFEAGHRDRAHELFVSGERLAELADIRVFQVHGLVLRHLVEGNLMEPALLESIGNAVRDILTWNMHQEAAPVALMAACLAQHLGKSPEPYLAMLNPRFSSIQQSQILMRHYEGMLKALQERHQSQVVQPFPKFITHSPQVLTLKEKLDKIRNTDVRVLLEGESGTGKSFLARQIHESAQKAPFVVVDCTNLEENLFESKLFGHLRGSFTGAVADAVGLVEQANGGTLFLDEIGEISNEIQGKLLYIVEEQRYRPVGAKSERLADFRVIAATNRNIDDMLTSGALRSDLFFRLAGFRVTIPPLRERPEDIGPLAEHRLQQLNLKYGRRKFLRRDVWESFMAYSWPGNVRELNTTLERGYHLSSGRHISLDDLALGLSAQEMSPIDLSWFSIRRDHLLRVLRLCRGNVSKAAQILGLNRTTLIYKLKLLEIQRKDFDPKCSGPLARDEAGGATTFMDD